MLERLEHFRAAKLSSVFGAAKMLERRRANYGFSLRRQLLKRL